MERTGRFEIYKDRAKEWRWRLIAPNGKTVADSGEGYRSRRNVVNAINRLPGITTGAPILDAPNSKTWDKKPARKPRRGDGK